MNRQTLAGIVGIAILSLMTAYLAAQVTATPSGSTIISNTTEGTPTTTPGNRTDERGTITTLVLSAVQQDDFWKAYVGNISGRLSLDSASGYTIYDWPVTVNKVGEVYITRSSSPSWANVSCANDSSITGEQGYIGMSMSQSDNINKTFNDTNNHIGFLVGSTAGPTTITADTCRSTATYVNASGARQTMDGSQIFQQILLQDDTTSNLIFVSIINETSIGYDNSTYDFQAIVPDAGFYNSTATTYYFYTELG